MVQENNHLVFFFQLWDYHKFPKKNLKHFTKSNNFIVLFMIDDIIPIILSAGKGSRFGKQFKL